MINLNCRKGRSRGLPALMLMAVIFVLGLAMAFVLMPTNAYAEGDVPKATFNGNGGTFGEWVWNEETEDYDWVTSDENVVTAEFDEDEDKYFIYDYYVSVPDREDFNFDYWSLDPEGKSRVDFEDPYQITKDTTFYAQWKRTGYVLTFDAGIDGFFPDHDNAQQHEEVFYFGEEWLNVPRPEKPGYVFSHWEDSNGNKVEFTRYNEDIYEEELVYQPSKDETFTAVWIEGVPVTLKANDPNSQGDEIKFAWRGGAKSEIVLYYMPNETIDDLYENVDYSSDNKYKIVGWKNENGRKVNLERVNVGTSGVTLYAIWERTLEVTLHAGQGTFVDGETTRTETFDIGDSLYWLTTIFTSDTNKKKVWHAWDDYTLTPNDDSEAFEGWYTNDVCTEALELEYVTEDLVDECNGELDLYAKYTNNYSTISIHAGEYGAFGGDNELRVVRIPEDSVVDFSGCGISNYDEDRTIKAWFSDASLNNRILPIEDDFYTVSDGMHFYPLWGEPFRGRIEFSKENEQADFYSDVDYGIQVRLLDEDENTINDGYSLEYSLKAQDGETELDLVNDGQTEFFSVDGEVVNLKGQAIMNRLENDRSELTLTVRVLDEFDNEVDNGSTSIGIVAPYEEYSFYGSEHMDISYDKPIMVVGESIIFEMNSYVQRFSSVYPEGEYFNFEILNVVSEDPSVIRIEAEEDMEHFMAYAKKIGKTTLIVSYKDIEGNEKTERIEAEVDDWRYNVEFDDDLHRDFLIGKSLALKVSGVAEQLNPDYDPEEYDWDKEYIRKTDGFDFEWKSSNDLVKVDKVEGRPDCAIVTADDSLLNKSETYAVITVELIVDGKVKASTQTEVYPQESYYELTNTPEVDSMMRKGQTVKISPKLRFYSVDLTESEYEEVKNVEYEVTYDTGVFSVKDSKGAKLNEGDRFTGSCTVTRTGFGEGDFGITAFVTTDDDDETYGTEWAFSVDELFDFSKAKVSAIKNAVYTGKAIKPNPTVKYYGEELWRNEDYTVSYKNNVKVGTATVTFTGKDYYCGTIKKTFKINPKGTALKKLKKGKKSFTVTWKKNATQTTGYQIQYSLKKNFKGAKTVTIKKNKTVKTTVKKLKAKKKYYVKIRTYKQIGKTKYYSSWSKVKTIKTK